MIELSKPQKPINASITLPASKSISNRLLIIQALAEKQFEINNLSTADDTQVLAAILTQHKINSENKMYDVGAAGTAMRFLTAYFATQKGTHTLTGSKRMQQRPIQVLVKALQSLGAKIEYRNQEGYPPLLIKGQILNADTVTIKGDVSSQYISALLLIAPTLYNGLTINIEGELISKPYIQMTTALMQQCGVEVLWEENKIIVKKGEYNSTQTITVEADWSAASYWFQLIALADNAQIKLNGLFKNSLQGDAVLQTLFLPLGVKSEFVNNTLTLTKTAITTKQFNYNFIDCPDIAQTLAATCVGLKIPFTLTGLASLKIKETDRIEALQTEFQKFGINAICTNDSIAVNDYSTAFLPSEKIIEINTYNDHRMAMCMAPLVMITDTLKIKNPEVVTKSYPAFWEDFRKW